MCAIRGDDGSIESNQRWQSLGHPVSYHSHGAEHRANLQHGNTHPNTHTFTHRTHRNSGSHTQSKLLTAIMLVKRATRSRLFSSTIQSRCFVIKHAAGIVPLLKSALLRCHRLENKSWRTRHFRCLHMKTHQVQTSSTQPRLQEMLLETAG